MAFTPVDVEDLRHIWLRSGTIWIQDLLLMAKVLLQIDAKALVKSLIAILIIEENLAELSESGHSKLWSVCAVALDLWLDLSHLVDFVYLENANRVTWYVGLDINLVMNCLSSILVPSLLLNDVGFDISELLVLPRPCLSRIVRGWKQHFNESVVCMHRWIMNNNEERTGILIMVDWTLMDSLVLSQSVTSLELIFQLYVTLRFY